MPALRRIPPNVAKLFPELPMLDDRVECTREGLSNTRTVLDWGLMRKKGHV